MNFDNANTAVERSFSEHVFFFDFTIATKNLLKRCSNDPLRDTALSHIRCARSKMRSSSNIPEKERKSLLFVDQDQTIAVKI